jgi:thioredoxin-like negative regulator of GroEL
MSTKRYQNNVVVEEWNDDTRTYTDYRPNTNVTRAYNAAENAAADANATAKTQAASAATLKQDLDAALTSLQAIIDDTNANINQNPAQRIKDIARALKKTIRVVNDRFEATT